MITQDQQSQIDTYLKSTNYTPPSQMDGDWFQQTAPKAVVEPLLSIGELAGQQYVESGKKVQEALGEFQKFPEEGLPAVGKGVLKTGVGLMQGIYAPFTALTQAAIQHLPSEPGGGENIIEAFAKSPLGQKLGNWAEANPEHANKLSEVLQNLSDAGVIAGGIAGLKGFPEAPIEKLPSVYKEVIPSVKAGVPELAGKAKAIVFGTPAEKEVAFIRDLVTPRETTKTLTQDIRAGKVEEGGLLMGRKTTPSLTQIDMENEIRKVPGISPKNTLLENANAIHNEIGSTATGLRESIKTGDIIPIVSQEDMDTLVSGTLKKIGEDPTMVGNAEESARRILKKFDSFLPKEGDITAENILDARQKLDSWMTSLKSERVFDPPTENAQTIALRAVRQEANKLLAQKAPDTAVAELLRRQTLLYDAIENIAPKAAREGGTGVLRFFNKHPILKKATIGASIAGGGFLAGEGVKSLMK